MNKHEAVAQIGYFQNCDPDKTDFDFVKKLAVCERCLADLFRQLQAEKPTFFTKKRKDLKWGRRMDAQRWIEERLQEVECFVLDSKSYVYDEPDYDYGMGVEERTLCVQHFREAYERTMP